MKSAVCVFSWSQKGPRQPFDGVFVKQKKQVHYKTSDENYGCDGSDFSDFLMMTMTDFK